MEEWQTKRARINSHVGRPSCSVDRKRKLQHPQKQQQILLFFLLTVGLRKMQHWSKVRPFMCITETCKRFFRNSVVISVVTMETCSDSAFINEITLGMDNTETFGIDTVPLFYSAFSSIQILFAP